MENFITRLKSGEPESWLLAFAVYSLIVGTYSIVFYLRISRWPSVVGELNQAVTTGLTRSAALSDRNYTAEVSYRYQIGGDEYHGNRLSPFLVVASHNLRFLIRQQMRGIKACAGGGVRVFYNPRRPEKSYLIAPHASGYAVILSVMFLPMVAYLCYAA